MSRSEYIYIIRDPDGRIVAPFTVKYEAQRYCRGLDDNDRTWLRVTRFRDGNRRPELVKVMSVAEFLTS